MASYFATQAWGGLAQKAGYTAWDWDTDTIQIRLCGASCNIDSVRHTAVFLADVTLDEYGSVTGYAPKTLGTKTVTVDSTSNGRVVFSSAAVTYTLLAPSKDVHYVIGYKFVTSTADSPIIFVVKLSDLAPSAVFQGTNNDAVVTPPATGWCYVANNA